MKFVSFAFVFLMVTAAIGASPTNIYFAGNEAKVTALFQESVDNQVYHFLIVKKQELTFPRVRQPYMSSLPKELRKPNKKDRIIAAVIIDDLGKVIEVQILETSDERLNQFVKHDLQKWIYYPAKKKGSPVACCVFQPFEYKIESIEELAHH